ncbi:MAG: 16S rRNA (guanine(966)-N(2))-methyltransferase RsmD [Chlamydiales bacterium]|nr:16S rRNA (guanine(966)-N(2))-methyltransferase RsmD [Chlamydiales bacterium]
MRIISGKFRGMTLVSPKKDHVRPTLEQLRASVFNICGNAIDNANFLDLFAGSGAMGLEALSRGASFTTFVEQDRHALDAIKKNIAKLNVEDVVQVMTTDAFIALKRFSSQKQQFSIIYIDPPYSKDPSSSLASKALAFIDQHSLLKDSGILFLEDRVLKGQEEPKLLHMQLKSARRFGSTLLKEYEAIL